MDFKNNQNNGFMKSILSILRISSVIISLLFLGSFVWYMVENRQRMMENLNLLIFIALISIAVVGICYFLYRLFGFGKENKNLLVEEELPEVSSITIEKQTESEISKISDESVVESTPEEQQQEIELKSIEQDPEPEKRVAREEESVYSVLEELRKKGRLDGLEKNFEGADVVVNGLKKTIYISPLIMEEMSRFVKIRSQIYGDSSSTFSGEIHHPNESISKKNNFREIVNQLERESDYIETSIGKVNSVKIKNYRNAKHALAKEQLNEAKLLLHEGEINTIESDVYTEIREGYGQIINNLREEIRLITDANDLVLRYFNYQLERIACYWGAAKENFNELTVMPPSDAELLALKQLELYGDMEKKIEQKRLEIQKYELKREELRPRGIIEKLFGEEL